MSSMLEQAIIDAKQLRESAQKNAEETVIEKYQIEIKEAIDKILEQEDLGMDPVDDMGGEMDMGMDMGCLLYTSPSPRDRQKSRMPSSA